jgi:hypothetical protein
MTTRDAALLDNWTLQDVSHALARGLSPTRIKTIRVDGAADAHSWDVAPEAAIQLQCLLDLVLDIVLRESVTIDGGYAHAWRVEGTVLNALQEAGHILTTTVAPSDPRIAEKKRVLVEDICATASLRTLQRENEISYARTRQSVHEHESALLWGSAGNLARAAALDVVYSAHPYRRRLMEQTTFPVARPDVVRGTVEWVQRSRARLMQQFAQGSDRRMAVVELPPIATDIIHASETPADLLLNAVQARHQHRRLRTWLGEYQTAMDEQDPKALAKHKKTLDAVARDLGRLTGDAPAGSTAISLNVGFFGLSVAVEDLYDRAKARFGVRADFNRLLTAKGGDGALDKLLGMFGERDTSLGQDVRRYFHARATDTLLSVGGVP